jgi:hypothetical protein
MNTIVVPEFTKSGYGDRMNDLLCLMSFARVNGKQLYILWEDYKSPHHSDFPAWRLEDTRIENFTQFFKLPSDVILSYTPFPLEMTNVFPHYIGGIVSPSRFYDTYVTECSREVWEETVAKVKSDLELCVPKYVPDTPYAVVHLRRTDKLRGADEYQLHQKDLDTLNQETFAAIRASEYKTFYISTDDPSSSKEYIEYIESLGRIAIQPPNVHNLLPSYFDTWMMRSSSLIIVSMKYSTFSLLPSLWWNIPLWTVLPDASYFELGFGKNAPIHYFKDTESFANLMKNQ